MNLGYVGLGNMGGALARRLMLKEKLRVYDLRPEVTAAFAREGAVPAQNLEALGRESDLVMTCLPTSKEVRAAVFGPGGLLAGLKPGAIVADMTTGDPAATREMAAEAADRGITLVDAPVSGGPEGAASGRLAIWVGGERDVFDRHLALLQALSDKPAYIGETGAGTIAKLVHNMTSLGISAVLGEMMTVGVKAGLDPLALFEAIRSGAAGRARSFDKFGKRILAGDLDTPSFQLRLAYKDAGLALRLAREFDVETTLSDAIYETMTEAMDRGWGGRDSQAFLLLQQERAGIPPMKVDPHELQAVFDRT